MKDAKGHGSNPRGGNSVDMVYSSKAGVRGLGKGMYARTANGEQYKLNPAATGGMIPHVGSTIDPSEHTRVPTQPSRVAPGYAGRDALGRTYPQALSDHDRFPKQNPNMPNAEDYRTPTAGSGAAHQAAVNAVGQPAASPNFKMNSYTHEIVSPTGDVVGRIKIGKNNGFAVDAPGISRGIVRSGGPSIHDDAAMAVYKQPSIPAERMSGPLHFMTGNDFAGHTIREKKG